MDIPSTPKRTKLCWGISMTTTKRKKRRFLGLLACQWPRSCTFNRKTFGAPVGSVGAPLLSHNRPRGACSLAWIRQARLSSTSQVTHWFDEGWFGIHRGARTTWTTRDPQDTKVLGWIMQAQSLTGPLFVKFNLAIAHVMGAVPFAT